MATCFRLLFGFVALTAVLPAAAQPAKTYAPVAVTIPAVPNDPSLDAFRARLSAIAGRKDKAELAKLLTRNFFWDRDFGGGFDKRKSPLVNLSLALGLDTEDAIGWRYLAAFAAVQPGAHSERKGIVCAPPEPRYDAKAFEAAIKATDSDLFEWSYPARDGIVVRERGAPDAPEIGKLGLHFVYTDLQSRTSEFNPEKDWAAVILPDGKRGFVAPGDLLTPLDARLCYTKTGGQWRIAGYIGGGD
jgi:hypothetical protein